MDPPLPGPPPGRFGYNPDVPSFHYVYVLRSLNDAGLYVGSTQDLRTRLRMHNRGVIPSTKRRRPFELIFYEAYRSGYDAKRREIYLKSTKGRTTLKTMLRDFLEHG
jgi:putative endonuclease